MLRRLPLVFLACAFALSSVVSGCGPGARREAAAAADTGVAAAAPSGPRLRFVKANGVQMRIAELGEGPLVLFLHGFPESWYSWRHQLPAIAAAGYRAVAPDLRGYGKTDKPANVDDYDIRDLTDDVVGLIDALGEKTAVVVGHDWGALVAWNAVLLHPERFTGLVAMSVPYSGRAAVSPLETMKKTYGDNFYYILYFQEPGVAEAEFDKNPREILSRLYQSPDSPREPPEITDPKRSAGGWTGRMGKPKGLPPWLTAEDLDYYVREFTEAGFRGGINFYRNFHRNWEITPELTGRTIEQPTLFIAGERDGVIRRATAEQLRTSMSRVATDLRGVTLVPQAGHWVQQEEPAQTNTAIVNFLAGLRKSTT